MERNINRLSEGLVRYIARVFGIDIIEKSFSIFRSVHFPGHENSSKLSPIVHVYYIQYILGLKVYLGLDGTFPGNYPGTPGPRHFRTVPEAAF